MARPYPTDTEVLEIRPDLVDFLQQEDDIATVTAKALKQVKIDLEDKRGILWNRVWDADNSKYFVGSDDYTRNDDKIVRMISLKAIAMVFRDYAINMGADSQWFQVSAEYGGDYMELLNTAKLDIDADDSGTITVEEDAETGQRFLKR